MSWVRLDDQFPDHPKIVAAGPVAAWLYVCGLAYCARHLTDGFIQTGQLPRLLPVSTVGKLAARLVGVGLWEPAPGGWRVHDYLCYNPTRAATLATRQQRASNGRKGGWQKAGKVPEVSQSFASVLPGTVPGVSQEHVSAPVPVPVPITTSTSTEHLPELQTSPHDTLSPPLAAERVRREKPGIEPKYPPEFEKLWLAYPRRREKVAAHRAWVATVKAGADPDELIAAARHCAAHVEAIGTEERFIPLPATFLGPQRKWLDFRSGPPEAPRPPHRNGRMPTLLSPDLPDRSDAVMLTDEERAARRAAMPAPVALR